MLRFLRSCIWKKAALVFKTRPYISQALGYNFVLRTLFHCEKLNDFGNAVLTSCVRWPRIAYALTHEKHSNKIVSCVNNIKIKVNTLRIVTHVFLLVFILEGFSDNEVCNIQQDPTFRQLSSTRNCHSKVCWFFHDCL